MSFTATTLGISQAHSEQASRCDPVFNFVGVALVVIPNGLTDQDFLLQEQRTIRVKYKHPCVWLVGQYKELVLCFELGGNAWVDRAVGFLRSLGHVGLSHCWNFCFDFPYLRNSTWGNNHDFTVLRHERRIKDHSRGQHASVDCLNDVTDGGSNCLSALGSVSCYIFLQLGEEL